MYFSFHSLFPSGGNRHPQARKPWTYTDLQCNMEEGDSGEVCKRPWGPKQVEIIVRLGRLGKAAQGKWNAPQFQTQTGRQQRDMCKRIQVPKSMVPLGSVWVDLRNRCEISSVQSLSRVQLFETPWTAGHQASLSIASSHSLLKLV